MEAGAVGSRVEGDGAVEAAARLDAFTLDAAVGPDLARVEWTASALGPPQDWPLSLRTALSILLTSRFPMWMAWGEELTFFCNAAYRSATLGRKYPWALGRPASEVWAEIWPEIGPRIRAVLDSGEATWDEALLLFLERSGYTEETYHTFSYSPLRDDVGTVVGMLCVVSEETERVVAERRMATLRELGSDPAGVRTDEQELLAYSARQLERNRKDYPFTLTYLFEDGAARLAATSGIPRGHRAAPAVIRLRDESGSRQRTGSRDPRSSPGPNAAQAPPETRNSQDSPDYQDSPDSQDSHDSGALWPAAAAAKGEASVVALEKLAGLGPVEALPTGEWREPPTHAVVQPLAGQGGDPYGFLVAAVGRYRPLDDDYRGFVELTAGHLAAGIAGARFARAQQRRAEELAELDRAKTVFFSNVSHEFRTPLTLIMSPVEELLARLDDADPQTREDLEVVRRNGLRLGKLVNTLLEFSRIEAGRVRARFAPLDLSALTAEFASVFRSAVAKAGLAFEVDCPPLPEPVYVDPELWEKVVLNLLSNALKFTFEGSIRVRARAVDGRAVVTVADTGVGVPERELPRLFERFHRVGGGPARSTEGSGIGLALVKELVALHGGGITAAAADGGGTVFTVSLPFGRAHLPADALAPANLPGAGSATAASSADAFVQEALRWLPEPGPEPAPELEAAGAAGRTGQGPAAAAVADVLVVDDNADMREYLSRLMRGAGHRVRAAADGETALRLLRAQAPDLVISDVMMPGMSGLDLVAALRRERHTAGVPVLLLSARAGQEASVEGLGSGADDYLVKPFTAADLLARVRGNVELSRLRGHHARWRNTLVESLQDGFFVAEEDGSVVEINAAFAEILGYGPEGLPYPARHPWWPDPAVDPQAARTADEALGRFLSEPNGTYSVPVTTRDGRRLWLTATFNELLDPETGRRMKVGTFRDVTAEHYAVQRDAAVAAVSLSLSRSTDLGEALAGVLDEVGALWRADRVLAVVFSPETEEPAVTATQPGVRWETLGESRRAALTRLSEGPPLIAHEETGPGAGAGVALEHPRGTLVLWLDLGRHRPFTVQDRLLLAVLAGHLAQGLRRAHQIDQQRETALALQRAILGPSALPPGFAVRYEPAARPLEVGGDWYDTVALADGRIGIVVGDCVGRGLEAATVMGQLRSACRALLLQDPRPDRVLVALDHFAAGVPGALCTTVFCGVLDPATGTLTYSSAGHPPGIIARADGGIALLEGGRSFPLAVRPGAPRPYGVERVPARATVLLYTDGLVERRRKPLMEGIEEAGFALRDEQDAGVEALAGRVMARMAPAEGYEDDVAVLLYRHPGPFETVFAADPERLAGVRDGLRGWLERCRMSEAAMQKVLVAAGEACTNSIEHAHRRTGGNTTVRLRAEAFAEHVMVTVADTGRWRAPRRPEQPGQAHRGHGTDIMRGLSEDVAIDTGEDGTVVTLHIGIDR